MPSSSLSPPCVLRLTVRLFAQFLSTFSHAADASAFTFPKRPLYSRS